MSNIPFKDRYQHHRQYAMNPQSLHPSLNDENALNPATLLTSKLVDQNNVLRYDNVKAVKAEYYLRSKSATPIGRLLTKLMNDERYQAYYSEATRTGTYNTGVVTINLFNSAINLSDYQLLVFDKEGFKISDYKNSTWYIVNNTLYIVLMNCTRYRSEYDDPATFADEVSVVFLKKITNRDEVKIGLLEFPDGELNVTDSMQPMYDLPEYLEFNYSNLSDTNTVFPNYPEECYGVALYVSDYMIDEGEKYYQDGEECVATAQMITTIQNAIDQTGMKNWMFINPNLYTISRDNATKTIKVEFKEDITKVEDLGLKLYADYVNSTTEAGMDSLPRIEIPIVRLMELSRFYLYNKNTFVKTEYTYSFNADGDATKPNITISRDSTVYRKSIERSFNIDVDDEDNTKILGQYPNYIPMNWWEPNVNSDDEDTDARIYSRWIDTEDVFVFIDGVKLTPYKDYIVSNEGIIGEDIPAGSIKFINRVDESIAITYPVYPTNPEDPEQMGVYEHTILAFTVPSTKRTRNTYVGPYKSGDVYVDPIKDRMTGDEYGKYPIIDVRYEYMPYKLPPSMLSAENYIIFKSGRYNCGLVQRESTVTDYRVYIPNLQTYNDIEYHSYFDENLDLNIDSIWHVSDLYFPLIERVIEMIEGPNFDYNTKYIENRSTESERDYRISDSMAQDYGTPIDFISGAVGANIFELWLRHNTRLVHKHDMDAQASESIRRVPDRQTYFSANEDLSLRGYKNNIHVDGNGMQGMPEYTASNDINNTENLEDEPSTNP